MVVADKPQELSEGGIYFPSQAQEKPQIGTVRWAGPGKYSEFPVVKLVEHIDMSLGARIGRKVGEHYTVDFDRIPMSITSGDRILFGKYSGAEVEINREKFIVLRETEVLAVLMEEDQ